MNIIKNDEHFYTIYGWMLNRLKLSGNELGVYAIIYGYSQNGVGEFVGSRNYVMNALGIKSNKTLCEILKRLVKKGYILEVSHNRTNGGKANVYRALSKEEVLKMLDEKEKEETEALNASCSACEKKEEFTSEKVEKEKSFVEKGRNERVEVTHGECKNYTLGSVKITPDKCKNYTCESVETTHPFNKEYIYNYKKEYKIKDKKEERKNENTYKGEKIFEKTDFARGENYGREKYEEIMDRHSLSKRTKEALFKFIAHCNLNGKMLTNDKLERIIIFLEGKNEEEKEKLVLKAIDKGYFDILREERKPKRSYDNSSSSVHFENERKYTEEYFDSLITKISEIKV